eukprot:557290-Alexandrium_andersonii.AAC.1
MELLKDGLYDEASDLEEAGKARRPAPRAGGRSLRCDALDRLRQLLRQLGRPTGRRRRSGMR